MCVHACLLTCLSLYVQIAEAFKLPFSKRNTSNLNGLLAESELVDLHTNSAASTTPKILFREFKRQQQQSTNFFPQESLVLVYHIQRGRIFSCLFVWLFVFALCIFVCASLSLVVLCVIGCHTYSLKRSSECPLISFDKDQPNTILSQRLRTT